MQTLRKALQRPREGLQRLCKGLQRSYKPIYIYIYGIWSLILWYRAGVPGRGRQKSPKCRAGPAGVLGRPCGTGPGYGPGFAKIAKMLAWARGGAGPAPWARRGPRWSRRGCEPGQIEHLPGTGVNHISLYKTNTFRYRAELAKVKNLGWTRAGAGLNLWSCVWGHQAGAAGVLGWAPGWANAGLDLRN